jgi:uncharacterized protein YjiS (DUF1127 family)
MSAPMTKSQMAFELPRLSYIDTRWEEPVVQPAAQPASRHGVAAWLAARIVRFSAWRARARTLTELHCLSDRELIDVGLNRGDFDRMFDARYNQDLRSRGRLG